MTLLLAAFDAVAHADGHILGVRNHESVAAEVGKIYWGVITEFRIGCRHLTVPWPCPRTFVRAPDHRGACAPRSGAGRTGRDGDVFGQAY